MFINFLSEILFMVLSGKTTRILAWTKLGTCVTVFHTTLTSHSLNLGGGMDPLSLPLYHNLYCAL